MKLNELINGFARIFICLILMLCIFGCDNLSKEAIQTARIMITGPGMKTYLFEVKADGIIQVASAMDRNDEGLRSLKIQDFPKDSTKSKSKKLSDKEMLVVDDLITGVIKNGDENNTISMTDGLEIYAVINEVCYVSSYYRDEQDGDIAVQNLTYKLVELSPMKIRV